MPSDPVREETGGGVARFRKRPVEVEARLLGEQNAGELVEWILGEGGEAFMCGGPRGGSRGGTVFIETLEGRHHAAVGDWIIKGVAGEFYPCKPDIFAATHEPASVPSSKDEEGGRCAAVIGGRCEKSSGHDGNHVHAFGTEEPTWWPIPAPSVSQQGLDLDYEDFKGLVGALNSALVERAITPEQYARIDVAVRRAHAAPIVPVSQQGTGERVPCVCNIDLDGTPIYPDGEGGEGCPACGGRGERLIDAGAFAEVVRLASEVVRQSGNRSCRDGESAVPHVNPVAFAALAHALGKLPLAFVPSQQKGGGARKLLDEREGLLNALDLVLAEFARTGTIDDEAGQEQMVNAVGWFEQSAGRRHEFHDVLINGATYEESEANRG